MKKQNINLEDKLEDFILLLNKSDLDLQRIENLKSKANIAFNKKIAESTVIEEIKSVSLLDINDLDKLNQLEILLKTNHIDSSKPKREVWSDTMLKAVRLVIGFLMITLGFAMVVMPTPHSFEMFTIFWFNPNDGVTLMDLISLIIIAVGTYIIIKSFIKFNQ